jgi:hypothetical protein
MDRGFSTEYHRLYSELSLSAMDHGFSTEGKVEAQFVPAASAMDTWIIGGNRLHRGDSPERSQAPLVLALNFADYLPL